MTRWVWEGDRRSGDALAMCHFVVYPPRLKAHVKGDEHPPKLTVSTAILDLLSGYICLWMSSNVLTFESLDVESSFLVCWYIFRIPRSCSYTKDVRSRSGLEEQNVLLGTGIAYQLQVSCWVVFYHLYIMLADGLPLTERQSSLIL